ncbi:hypothetical protein SMD11_0888 [Streptomyces albireticuli]|uniref:Uncharacterized protein n=1 Tax=Streptomyces albireticuli TaxID=1940 RepID=A0A1Z2KWX9_9ACTN|nr:hypothetical protein SMD11_0888 [Streptomyces albireticuli]
MQVLSWRRFKICGEQEGVDCCLHHRESFVAGAGEEINVGGLIAGQVNKVTDAQSLGDAQDRV